MQYKLHFKLN